MQGFFKFFFFPIAIQMFPHQPAHGTLRTLRTTSGMGVTTQKTSRSLSSDFGFLKKKNKKRIWTPPKEKEQRKGENI